MTHITLHIILPLFRLQSQFVDLNTNGLLNRLAIYLCERYYLKHNLGFNRQCHILQTVKMMLCCNLRYFCVVGKISQAISISCYSKLKLWSKDLIIYSWVKLMLDIPWHCAIDYLLSRLLIIHLFIILLIIYGWTWKEINEMFILRSLNLTSLPCQKLIFISE